MGTGVEFISDRTKEVLGRTGVDPSPPHTPTPSLMETPPLPLSLGKKLECRERGESTRKGKEGRAALNVCACVCVQKELKQRQHERKQEYPDIYEQKRENAKVCLRKK